MSIERTPEIFLLDSQKEPMFRAGTRHTKTHVKARRATQKYYFLLKSAAFDLLQEKKCFKGAKKGQTVEINVSKAELEFLRVYHGNKDVSMYIEASLQGHIYEKVRQLKNLKIM